MNVSDRDATDSPIGSAELLQRWDGSEIPMWIFDVHTLAFLAVNDAAVQRYGYSRSDFLAMTILDIRPIDDIVPVLREELQAHRHNSDHENWRHCKKNGRVIEVEITSREVTYNGRKAEVVVAVEVTRGPDRNLRCRCEAASSHRLKCLGD